MNWSDRLRVYERKLRQFWAGVPASSMAVLMAFAFCLFTTIGLLSRISDPPPSVPLVWFFPFVSGGFAAIVLWSTLRRRLPWSFGAVAFFMAVQFGLAAYVKRHSLPQSPLPAALQRELVILPVASIVLITCAWGLALLFVNREGQRFFKVQTEIELAGEIHRAVVPTIDMKLGNYEFYGASLPSGTVGGDLVDVIAGDDHWLAYVVDVSGHGVSSGVLMAMIKSSIHTAVQLHPRADGLLDVVNQVLCSLKATNMFATCGLIVWSREQGLRYVLAGHPPLLRLRDRQVELLGESNLPLGILPGGGFHGASCEVRKGDVLVLVTDGLTEVTDQNGEEQGFRQISEILSESDGSSAKEIVDQIFRASGGGARSDDQSILIVRRLA